MSVKNDIDINEETKKELKKIFGEDVTFIPYTRKEIKNPCEMSCCLCKSGAREHGYTEQICIITGDYAPLGHECPYSHETKILIQNKIKGKRVVIL